LIDVNVINALLIDVIVINALLIDLNVCGTSQYISPDQ